MPSMADVKQLVERGLAFPCAMCRHYWDAAPQNGKTPLSHPWNCHQKECGGPIAGKTFPEHTGGSLPPGDWTHFCFVCACPHELSGVKVVGGTRTLAVCDKHKSFLDKLAPVPRPGEIIHERPVLVIDRTG